MRRFQASRKLEVDGIIGPQTLKALFPEKKDALPLAGAGIDDVGLVWFSEARRLIGVMEETGHGDNKVILDWAKAEGIPYKSDDIPWCGLFVAHCIGSTLDREPMPAEPLRARAWLAFGQPCAATVGAVMVFWRDSKLGTLGHVGFYGGEDKHNYLILGGNQGDKVCWAKIGKDRFLQARWPSTVSHRPAGPVLAALDKVPKSSSEA